MEKFSAVVLEAVERGISSSGKRFGLPVATTCTGEAIVSYVVKTASGDRLYANLLR